MTYKSQTHNDPQNHEITCIYCTLHDHPMLINVLYYANECLKAKTPREYFNGKGKKQNDVRTLRTC